MAGERWTQLVSWLAGLDTSSLYTALWKWWNVENALTGLDFTQPMRLLVDSGVVGEVRDPLTRSAEQMQHAIDVAVREYGETGAHSPARILRALEEEFTRIRTAVAQDDANYPSVLYGDADLQLLQQVRQGEFDLRADRYAQQIASALQNAMAGLDFRLYWPVSAGPVGDPDADLSSFGVPVPR